MTHTDLIVLTFLEPLRGRELRAGHLPSDRLWGALYATDALLQGTPLGVTTPFRVSSAFPYIADGWLLPRPRTLGAPAPAGNDPPGDRKAAKKLEYVNLEDFLALARGDHLGEDRLRTAGARQRRALLPVIGSEEPPPGVSAHDLQRALQGTQDRPQPEAFAQQTYAADLASLSDAERLHLARQARGRAASNTTDRQRNTQDRVTQATDTFTTSQLSQPRLGFLLESANEVQRPRLLAALRVLADSGLGGLRTQGSGQFTFEVKPVPPGIAERLNCDGPQVLLGLTRPSSAEAQDIDASEVSRYRLVRRDGFLDGSPLQRQDVWMLSEGSLVPGLLNGTIADVAPPGHPHPVYRSGLALSLGVRL
jgi:CRISPR type III-A-associated RAMP protein Csm4